MSNLALAIPTKAVVPSTRDRIKSFPQIRYMGSKYRLLPWIHEVLSGLRFQTAMDAFSGSGSVGYLLKAMGKQVIANDFLNFSYQIAAATIENSRYLLTSCDCEILLEPNRNRKRFIEGKFTGIFFTPEDLRFLDTLWSNMPRLRTDTHRAIAIAALTRSCVKRQPRGVFTVAGDPSHYKDGRRDVRLSIREHFLESVEVYNAVVFDNEHANKAVRGDILDVKAPPVDLVYMDPPYVPRADDNCYIKRYHFLEGLSSYWQAEDAHILETSKVKKIQKRYTPFSYRKSAAEAFDAMFKRFRESTLVLSYSSNGYPDLKQLIEAMKRYKRHVDYVERKHRYHFGTHSNAERNEVSEYLIIGQGS